MRFLNSKIWFGLFLLALFATSARADEVVLENGDRLSGQIVFIENGRLYLDTGYAGQLEFSTASVRELKTSNPVSIDLGSGTDQIGVVETTPTKQVRLVTKDKVYPFQPSAVQNIRQLTPEETASFGEFYRPMVWDHELELGTQLRTGNTNAQDVSGGYRSVMTSHRVTLTNNHIAAYGRANGTKSTQQVLSDIRLDYNHTPRFYSFYLFDGEHDILSNLQYRAREEAGVGYRVIKLERTQLNLDAGAGVSEEFWTTAADRINPIGHFGGNFMQKIGKESELGLKAVILPDFSDLGEFLSEAEMYFKTPIARRFLFRLSALDRYNSNPVAGTKSNDLGVRTSIIFRF